MKVIRCRICDSKFHLGNRCPKRNDTRETIFIKEMTVSLLAESFNVAIIDSVCTKQSVVKVGSNTILTASVSVIKIKLIFVNLVIPLNLVKLTADAIDYEIPLLLSEDSMKKINAMTDFKNDKMIMFQ